mgnify:CR=1 FL=1
MKYSFVSGWTSFHFTTLLNQGTNLPQTNPSDLLLYLSLPCLLDGAETNCRIAQNLGILLMNSNCFAIFFSGIIAMCVQISIPQTSLLFLALHSELQCLLKHHAHPSCLYWPAHSICHSSVFFLFINFMPHIYLTIALLVCLRKLPQTPCLITIQHS